MVRKHPQQRERRFRKATVGKSNSLSGEAPTYYHYDHHHQRLMQQQATQCAYRPNDDRKTYASKVRSLIEKKNRTLNKVKKTDALREELSHYPRRHRRLDSFDTDAFHQQWIDNNDTPLEYYDPDLEEVYESQKLNFRRMISNLSKGAYQDSDFDSWSDLESNFSLIYEPLSNFGSESRKSSAPSHQHRSVRDVPTKTHKHASPAAQHLRHAKLNYFDDDDINLTLEKVKNMKNNKCTNGYISNADSDGWLDNSSRLSSCCDSWSYCTCTTNSDGTSFLSSCSCCQTIKSGHTGNHFETFRHDCKQRGSDQPRATTRNRSPVSRSDSWTNSELSKIYEPVSAKHVVWTSRIKQLKRKLRANSLPKSYSEHWDKLDRNQYANFSNIPLPISTMGGCKKGQSEHQNQDDVHDDWEPEENVNLGLIYIPQDDEIRSRRGSARIATTTDSQTQTPPLSIVEDSWSAAARARTSRSSKTSDADMVQSKAEGSEDTLSPSESDPFSSLESLIFEPKESVFPEAIGRNNNLKASISISNISNRSNSCSSDATITGENKKEASEPKSLLTETSTIAGDFPLNIGSKQGSKESISNVGSYWDWGKSRALSQRNLAMSKAGSSTIMGAITAERDPYYIESSYVSEVQRSSITASECKTCAGTSVASWTYIGLGKVLCHNNNATNVNGNGDAARDDNQDELPTHDSGPCDKSSTPLPPPPPLPAKKEVTWKIISERNNRNVLTLLSQGGFASPKGDADLLVPLLDVYNSWSDIESLIFADERSIASTLKGKMGLPVTVSAGECNNRMNCYKDDWLFWDQQRKQRKMVLPQSQLTWRNKAKRMLLWMHYSQGQGGPPVEQWIWWKSKQRASILWLICKANNNKVPDDLKDPYYRDHDDQDQIKPLVVHALASAEYYCLALGNIYADPNYHNLNHWGVIQALARKGVYVAEPSDVALTETVLIQTSPLRLSAHMAVIEAIMALFLKETVTVERIVNSVRRFVPPGGPIELPTDIEEALVFWINKVCVKMKHRIEDEMNIATPEVQKENEENNGSGDKKDEAAATPVGADIAPRRPTSFRLRERRDDNVIAAPPAAGGGAKKDGDETGTMRRTTLGDRVDKSGNLIDKVAPPIPLLQDLGDLSDGCCLATLISYYCPTSLRWQDICLSDPMSMADSLYNLQLVQKFCRDHLPFDPCFLTLEDMVYQHSSVRQNILVLLAELFFLFEVRPAKCVKVVGPRPDLTSPEVPAAGAVRRNGHCGGLVSGATKRSFQNPVSPIPDLRNSTYSYNSFTPDTNRISPKCGSAPPHREPLLPRRQSSQHERMHERSKRFSCTDGPKLGDSTSPTSAMRRTHSMQDIDKNGAERPYSEVSPGIELRDTEGDANYYSTTSIGHPFYHPRKGRGRDEEVSDDTSELYLRPLTTGNYTDEPLMPAIIRPAKEKKNRDSKPEELGEHPRGPNHLRSSRGAATPQPTAPLHKRSPPLSDDQRNGRHSSSPQRRHVVSATDLPDKPAVPAKPDFLLDLQHKMDSGFYLGSPHHPLNHKGESDLLHHYDYLDNRELEEQLNGGGGVGAIYAKPTALRLAGSKQPFVLSTDDGVRLKEGLESLGSSESGVFLDHHRDAARKGAPLNNNNFQSTTSFAQLSKLRDNQIGGINIVYMQHERGDSSGSSEGGGGGGGGNRHNQPLKSSFLQKGDRGDKRTSFAALPNQTTWQQTGNKRNPSQGDSGHETPCSSDAATPETGAGPLAAQLCDVRLKLEDKRRRIEADKRKMELMVGRMRQRMGKAAFLQAVSKNRGGMSSGRATPDSGAGDEVDGAAGVQHRYSNDNAAGDTNGSNLLSQGEAAAGSRSGGRHTPSPPDLDDSMNYEEYSQSIDQLGSSLNDLQSDLQRLTVEQEQIQRLMHNGSGRQEEVEMEAPSQFFLHETPSSSGGVTQTWGSLAAKQAAVNPARSDSRQGEPSYAAVHRSPSREQVYQPIQRSASREQLYNQQQQQQQRSTSREQLYQPMQRSASREQLYQPQPMQRSASREQLYQPQPMQRSASREQLYQPMQRSSSREQLYQPMQRSASREQLYQPMQRSESREQLFQPLQRSVSREDLYQPMPIQRSVSREQLYQPIQRSTSREQLYPSMQRTTSREQLYQPMQRTTSREQLYQPMSLQRSPSHEQLYQPQPVHHMSQGGPPASWGHPMMTEVGPSHRQVPVGAVLPQQQQQHAYLDQSGYLLHQQPQSGGYVMQQPQYIPMSMHSGGGGMPMYAHPHQMQQQHHHPNGPTQDPYGHYDHYMPQQPQSMMDQQGGYGGYPHPQMQSPYRLHIEVPGGMGSQGHGMMQGAPLVGPSSRSQSPLTYHHQMQQQSHSRPPSRPPSAAGLPGLGPPSSLPAKATPVPAPPEAYMEPQSVHFIEASAVAATVEDPAASDLADMEEDAFLPLSAGADFSSRALSSLEHVTSGTATYRVRSGEPTSPTRPVLGKTFRVPKSKVLSPPLRDPPVSSSPLTSPTIEQLPQLPRGAAASSAAPPDKGFFVSFDDEQQQQQPKRPKPPLRTKKVPKGAAGGRSPEAGTPERETAPEIPEKTPLAYQTMSRASPSRVSPSRVSPPRGQPPTQNFNSTFNRTPVPYADHDSSFSDEVAQYAPVEGSEASPGGVQVVSPGVGFIIGPELVSPDPTTEDDMARRKEKILMSVIKRKEQQEAIRAKKEHEAAKRREQERMKQEMLERKKEDERIRRQAIFEQYKQRKAAMEDQENDRGDSAKNATMPKSKLKPLKPRPKSLHDSALSAAEHRATDRMVAAGGTRGSQTNLAGGSCEAGGYPPVGYRYADTDSGLGRATPPRRAPSPGQGPLMRHPPSPTAYGGNVGLPPGLVSHRMGGLFSDTASDSCSTTSSTVEYTGPKLFKQPTAKSNRGIIVNAINTVLAGAVNNDFKKRAVEEISRSDSKHFLILFRDSGCQFRALYSYSPEKEEVFKLFGTGPKQVTEKMMDKFFKYNCGGRNFSEIQTKHLTVTIDAFTIHNSLWQGKRPTPSKKDYL